MANNRVTITPDTNKVELTDQRRQILVTDNRTGVTINVTQTTPEIVVVAGRGPAGISGEAGPTGSVGPSGSTGPAGTVDINSGVTAGGNILPDTANTYDIGSSDLPFRDLYLSSSTLFLGDTKLSTDEQGGLKVVASGSDAPLPSALSGSFTGSFSGSFEGDGIITSASHAETASFAISASHEIIKEISSSFADTASLAQNLEGGFTYSGDVFTVEGNVFVQGTLDAATKNFKIDHPTMPGYYLVHSSLEGPERGIYHRGRLKVSDTIHLPDYWKDLPVDDIDITVQLTPIGNACQHWVKEVTKEKIVVDCDCGKPDCFYIIHAQRYDQGKFEILEPKQTKRL